MNDLGRQVVAYCNAMQIHIPWHWTCRTLAGRYPRLFNTVFGAINDRTRIVRPDTGLVIEGFPRSANSFSVFAFLNSGAGDMALAHHVHSPSQIILAAKYGIPAILLVRTPEDAVIAGVAKIATHTAPDLLRAYAVYYESLLPLREHYVIAPFETVTSDIGRIVSAVNRRFETSFAPVTPDRHAQPARRFWRRKNSTVSRNLPRIHRSLFRPHYSPGALLIGPVRLMNACWRRPQKTAPYDYQPE